MAYDSRKQLIEALEKRNQELNEQEPITEINPNSVIDDLHYFESLSSPTETDFECYQHDLNLWAMLQEGYTLAWGNDVLWINGIRRVNYYE